MSSKVTKDTVPTDFSLSLAIVDAIPVILFGLSMIVLSKIFSSAFLLVGASLCLFAGICKVLWKIIVVLKQKNIWFLFIQMRITMPIGLLLMIIAIIIAKGNIDWINIINKILSLPAIIFFVIGILGMSLMLVFAFALDGKIAKNNWIEQITNFVAQLAFFIGLLFLL